MPKAKRTTAAQSRSLVDTTRASSGPFWRIYLRALGPGLVTGASDDDPSGIATYAQAGAQFGFGLLWAALLTFPLMASVQEICDRTALATGKGLGELAVKRFSRRARPLLAVLLAALVAANALNIAADLVAVGSGMNLLHAGPSWLWALLTGVLITVAVVGGSFSMIARAFKLLCLALLAYVVEVFLVHASWGTILANTFVPHLHLTRAYVALLIAVLGTTISPYLFFWQSAHRMEELRDAPEGGSRAVTLKEHTPRSARAKQRSGRMDVFSGMAFSNVVMWAIIVVTAQTLATHGQHDIQSAAQAASALTPIAGRFATTLFALGFIGSGILAVPVLAGAGAAGMSGLLHKEWGFSRSIRKAPVFYGLVALGTIGGAALSLVHVNPIKLLVIVATINGLIAAPFLILVMLISGDRRLMGTYRNGRLASILGWVTVAVMAAAAVALVLPSVT